MSRVHALVPPLAGARAEAGLSARELGEAVGLSGATVAAIHAGRRQPTIRALAGMYAACGWQRVARPAPSTQDTAVNA